VWQRTENQLSFVPQISFCSTKLFSASFEDASALAYRVTPTEIANKVDKKKNRKRKKEKEREIKREKETKCLLI